MKNIDKINPKFLLPVVSASVVLRKDENLSELLHYSKKLKVNKQKIYEAILQTYLFAGYPAALNALKIFGKIYNCSKKNYKTPEIQELKTAGTKTCKKIYGDKFDKLISNVSSFSPELSEWLVIEGYGKVLSRRSLNLKKRELCIVSILSVLKFEDQLFSHINGAVRLKTKFEDIKALFKALKYIDKEGSKFGNLVLEKYIKTKKTNFI